MLYLSYFLLFIVDILVISTAVCFLKYKDFCIRLHAFDMFIIYCTNFLLLAICFYNFSFLFFLKTLTIIILNSLCSISVLHLLFKNTNLGDTKEYAIRREKMIKARKESIALMKAEMAKNIIENIEHKDNLDVQKQDKKSLADFFVDASKKKAISNNIATENGKNNNESKKNIDENKTSNNIEDNSIVRMAKNENGKITDEIKEQKKALKKKLETARRNAFITRKPEKIEETEKIIKDILDKYGLTEDMLDE